MHSRISHLQDSLPDKDFPSTKATYYERELHKMTTEGRRPSYPLGAYCMFSQARRVQLKAEHPSKSKKKIYSQIKREWKHLTDKAHYRALARSDYEAYLALLNLWSRIKEEKQVWVPSSRCQTTNKLSASPHAQQRVAGKGGLEGEARRYISAEIAERGQKLEDRIRSESSPRSTLQAKGTHVHGEALSSPSASAQQQCFQNKPVLLIVIDLQEQDDNRSGTQRLSSMQQAPADGSSSSDKRQTSASRLKADVEKLAQASEPVSPLHASPIDTCLKDEELNLEFSLLDELESLPGPEAAFNSTEVDFGRLAPAMEASPLLSPSCGYAKSGHYTNSELSHILSEKAGEMAISSRLAEAFGKKAEVSSRLSKRPAYNDESPEQLCYLKRRRLTE